MSGYESPPEAKNMIEPPKALPNIDVIDLYDRYKNGSPSEVAVNSTHRTLGLFAAPNKGSGFFVKSDDPHSCLVATAKSAFADGPSISLVDGNEYPAQVVLTDLQNDLALLRIPGVENPATECPAVSLSEEVLKPNSSAAAIESSDFLNDGQMVYAGRAKTVGPRAGLFNHVLPGMNMRNDAIALAMPGTVGGQGGPVFNDHGQVIGIVEGGNPQLSLSGPGSPSRYDTSFLTIATPVKYLERDLQELSPKNTNEHPR